MDKYEEIARNYIEGPGGLFDLYTYELGSPACTPPEVEGARWMLICLTNPKSERSGTILADLVEQRKLRVEADG